MFELTTRKPMTSHDEGRPFASIPPVGARIDDYPEPSIGHRRGDLVIGLPKAARYAFTNEGMICLVVGPGDSILKKCPCEFCEYRHRKGLASNMFKLVPVGHQDGTNVFEVEADCFRPVTDAERKKFLDERDEMRQKHCSWEGKSGTLLTVTRVLEVAAPGEFACGMLKVPAGSRVVLDDDFKLDKAARTADTWSAGVRPVDLHVPKLKVYYPDVDDIISVPSDAVIPFDEPAIAPILPSDHWKRINTTLRRVLDSEAHDQVYNRLGLDKLCVKGRGAIILMYGPPGTGKTLTAEAVSDHLKRPLVRAQLGSLNDSQMLRDKLARAFERAQKYKAILLLDEVDVFVRRRGLSPIFDDNTASFLRMLEYFDGILMMTTNLINDIDPAIFSRAHLILGYDAPNEEDRIRMWEGFLTKGVREVLIGQSEEAAVLQIIESVKGLNLNGREIKTIVQNAITNAFSRLPAGPDGKPTPHEAVKHWISPKAFVDEAKRLVETRESINGTRPS